MTLQRLEDEAREFAKTLVTSAYTDWFAQNYRLVPPLPPPLPSLLRKKERRSLDG